MSKFSAQKSPLEGAAALWAVGDVLLKGAVLLARGTSPYTPFKGGIYIFILLGAARDGMSGSSFIGAPYA